MDQFSFSKTVARQLVIERILKLSHRKHPNDSFVVATLGNFDGLHKGHQEILRLIRNASLPPTSQFKSIEKLAISFYPHPASVVLNAKEPSKLTSLRQKVQILSKFKFDQLKLIHFTKEFSRLSPENFIRDYLVAELNIDLLIIGADASIGYGRAAGAERIVELMRSFGRSAEIVSFVDYAGQKISSRAIRDAIQQGRIKDVIEPLGRPYSMCSKVVRGRQMGRALGYPTANIYPADKTTPQLGVYAAITEFNKRLYPSVVNVGFRPTFDSSKKLVIETHIFEDSVNTGDLELYGKLIEVFFIDKLRDEIKFNSTDELKEQIKKDIARARNILTEREFLKVQNWISGSI